MDRALFTRLGWARGDRLAIRCGEHDVLVATRAEDGPVPMRDRFVRVPYRLRRRVSLFLGDRVLLVGRISRGGVVICPPATMERFLADGLRLLER
ncbi:hypothetical protein [Nocardia wallacei]|uniref:hypothetical protein n=1 Tax=Nocardia wallacei TaxID=480035 RepID=UPI002453E9DD|nr:hypothetical protein [Nocardia wallacei]